MNPTQRFHVRASLYDVAPERLHELLKAVVGELSFRSRLWGYQMFHEGPGLQLSVETMDEVHPTYVLDARLQSARSGVEAWVGDLCGRLDGADILYLLDYVEEDVSGNELGEEQRVAHPEFDARYRARSPT